MAEVAIIGIDLAERVFPMRGAAVGGSVGFRRKLSRAQLLPSPAAQPRLAPRRRRRAGPRTAGAAGPRGPGTGSG